MSNPVLLQINSVANTGSTGRITEEIGNQAINDGWESHIAYGRSERTSKSKLIKIGTPLDFDIHYLQTRIFDRHGLASRRATENFIKKVQQLSPSIIHLHNIHGYFINIQVLFNYLARANVPVVWTFHDCWPFTGHCAYFDYVRCIKWGSRCNNCPQKNEYPSSIWQDRSEKNYLLKKSLFNSLSNLTIVTVSDWMGLLIKRSFLSQNKMLKINNGVDTSIFYPQNIPEKKRIIGAEGKFIILGVANIWNQRKGLSDFFQLGKLLDNTSLILLIGLSKKQIKNLPENVIGILKTENIHELSEFYNVADVFVNPTYEDNFPTTNLEALACGTPVITYDTGGSPESVSEDTGIIVNKGDIKGLINAMTIVKTNGKEFYSVACAKRAVKLFKSRDRFMDYIQLYRKLLADRDVNKTTL